MASCRPHFKKGRYTFNSLFYTSSYYFKHKKVVNSYKCSGFPTTTNTYDYRLTDSSVVLFSRDSIIEEIKTIKVGNKIILDSIIYNDKNNW